MKKTAILATAAVALFAATANAQTTDTVPVQKQTTTTTSTDSTATMPVSKDKYNNWSADTYKMQPMPEGLTTEKIFPVLGSYQLTDKAGNAANVSITLDPENKGIVWISGLPEGTVKATLRRSPAVYKIPAQKVGEDTTAKDAKKIAGGVLIYDKDANVMNVCIGCTYNAENPAIAFEAPAAEETTEADAPKKAKTSKSKKGTAKVAKVKPVLYTGTKVIESSTTAAAPAQQ